MADARTYLDSIQTAAQRLKDHPHLDRLTQEDLADLAETDAALWSLVDALNEDHQD